MNKLKINSVALYNLCNACKSVATPSGILPILSNLKISVLHNSIKVIATDNNVIVEKVMEMKNDEEFTFCVDAGLFCETLSTIPDQPITIEVEFPTLTIRTNSGHYDTGIDNHNEYPITDHEYPDDGFVIGDVLVDNLSYVQSLTGNNDFQAALKGVLFEAKGGELRCVATDTHRLGLSIASVENLPDDRRVLHPSFISQLKSNYKGGDIRVQLSENKIKAAFNGTTIQCSLLDVKYPNYEAIMPTEIAGTFLVHKGTLVNALKRCSVFANKVTNQVTFTMVDGNLTVTSKDLDFNNASEESVSGNYDGEDFSINLNSKYLLSVLNLIDSQHVEFKYVSDIKPAYVCPAEDDNLKYMVMPVVLVG